MTAPAPSTAMLASISRTIRIRRSTTLLDNLRQASTEADYLKAGEDLQEYATRQMLYFGVATLPDIEAASDSMKGYVFMRGYKKRFETVWLDK